MYNQIKATESREQRNATVLAEWKAGFMEDSEELHPATKPLFASVVRVWGKDGRVRSQFIANAPGGEERFSALMRRVEMVWERSARQATLSKRNGKQAADTTILPSWSSNDASVLRRPGTQTSAGVAGAPRRALPQCAARVPPSCLGGLATTARGRCRLETISRASSICVIW